MARGAGCGAARGGRGTGVAKLAEAGMDFGLVANVVAFIAGGIAIAGAVYTGIKWLLPGLLRHTGLLFSEIREVSMQWPPELVGGNLPTADRSYCYLGVAPFPGRDELVRLCKGCADRGAEVRVLLADPEDDRLLLACAEFHGCRDEDSRQMVVEQLRLNIARATSDLAGYRGISLNFHSEPLRYCCHIVDSEKAVMAVRVDARGAEASRCLVIRKAARGKLLEDCRGDFERVWRNSIPARVEAGKLQEVVSRERDAGRRARVLQRFCREQVEASLECLGDFLTGAECLGHSSPQVREASVELAVSGLKRFGRSTGKLLKELVGVLPRVSEERRMEALEQAATPEVVASLKDWDREQIWEVLWRMVRKERWRGPVCG